MSRLMPPRATQDQDARTLEMLAPGQREPLTPALTLDTMQLYQVERMAAQRMNLAQIGVRLRISERIWEAIVERNPAVREAYMAGMARGMDVATGAIFGAIEAGDVAAARYYLDRQGGPEWSPKPVQAVVVNAPQITIDAATSVTASLDRQRKLLEAEPIEVTQIESQSRD